MQRSSAKLLDFSEREGRLVEPNQEILEIVAKSDQIFYSFHGKELCAQKNPMEKLNAAILERHPNFPPRTVSLFCKVKFYSRIIHLNVDLKVKRMKNSVRNLKQNAQFFN